MERHRIEVPFVKGQHRIKARKVGRGIQFYKCRADRESEAAIAEIYDEQVGIMAPEGVEVLVTITTHRPTLASFRKSDGNSHPDTQKPDADNIAKLVLDALNGHAYADDSQVAALYVVKSPRVRGDTQRMEVVVAW